MEAEARAWIEAMVGEALPTGSIHDVLKDGRLLCLVANGVKPSICPPPSASGMPFKQMENIAAYLRACTVLGVPDHDMFQTVDLFENKNMKAVLTNVHSLGRVAQRVPGFGGPVLGAKLATATSREFSDSQMASSFLSKVVVSGRARWLVPSASPCP